MLAVLIAGVRSLGIAPGWRGSYNGHMSITIGSRELKNRLGAYLRMVREGVVVIVTDRGRPVAELRRIGPPADAVEERLRYLEASGLIARGSRRPLSPFKPVEVTGEPVSKTVIDDREDRV